MTILRIFIILMHTIARKFSAQIHAITLKSNYHANGTI